MEFATPLKQAHLIKRYKRFLADVRMPDGSTQTLHCPNTGSMKGCQDNDQPIWYSTSDNAKRKYPHTWELIQNIDGDMIGVNTHRANELVVEAIENGTIHFDYDTLKREVKDEHTQDSRFDIRLSTSKGFCYVEVKSVTLNDKGQGYFPDAVSTRGQKHLRTLTDLVKQGHQGALIFCVQHTGIHTVSPADHIDSDYGQLLRTAISSGVDVHAYGCRIDPGGIRLSQSLPVVV